MPKSIEDMSLSELFALSDEIGDKYLGPTDIATRNAELATLQSEISTLAQGCIQAKANTDRALADLKNVKRRSK